MELRDYLSLALSTLAIIVSGTSAYRQYRLNLKRDLREQQKEREQRTPWISIHVTQDEKSPKLFVLHCNAKNQNYRPVDIIAISVKLPGAYAIAEAEIQRVGAIERHEPTTAFRKEVQFSYFRLQEGESRDFALMLMKTPEGDDKPHNPPTLEFHLTFKDNTNTSIVVARTVSLT